LGLIGLAAGIFGLGQVIEGNVLDLKLVGIQLHPVWLILALSVFGSLFGFVGMLVFFGSRHYALIRLRESSPAKSAAVQRHRTLKDD
jgi:hypothetical protein